MPEINPPLWQQNAAFPSNVDRELFAALTDGPGVAREGDLEVAPGAGLSVDVAAGHAFVDGTEQADQGRYLVASSSTVNLALAAADPSNPRNDLVIARVQDAFYSGAVNAWALEVVTGTAASTPVDPVLPDNALVLARVRVNAGAASLSAGNVTDLRSLAPYKAGSPIGTIADYAGSTPPAGWLECNGQAVSRTLYAGLFAVIGTTFGPGDGSTTFEVPDLRGRFRIGTGTLGSDTYALGGAGGEARHVLTTAEMPSHTHSGPSHSHGDGTLATSSTGSHGHDADVAGTAQTTHSHTQSGTPFFATTPGPGTTGHVSTSAIQNDGAHTHNITGSTASSGTGNTGSAGSGTAHENRPPFLALVAIIRAA